MGETESGGTASPRPASASPRAHAPASSVLVCLPICQLGSGPWQQTGVGSVAERSLPPRGTGPSSPSAPRRAMTYPSHPPRDPPGGEGHLARCTGARGEEMSPQMWGDGRGVGEGGARLAPLGAEGPQVWGPWALSSGSGAATALTGEDWPCVRKARQVGLLPSSVIYPGKQGGELKVRGANEGAGAKGGEVGARGAQAAPSPALPSLGLRRPGFWGGHERVPRAWAPGASGFPGRAWGARRPPPAWLCASCGTVRIGALGPGAEERGKRLQAHAHRMSWACWARRSHERCGR